MHLDQNLIPSGHETIVFTHVQVPESEMSMRAKPQVSKFDILLMSISNFDKTKLQPVMVSRASLRCTFGGDNKVILG